MKMTVRLACMCIIISMQPIFTMEPGESSRGATSNNAQSTNSVVQGLALTVTVLSHVQSVVDDLKAQDALNVATLLGILDAAESPWQPAAILAMENIVRYTPARALPYLGSVAGACHAHGKEFIQVIEGQVHEGKSVSTFLKAVRYAVRQAVPNQELFKNFLKANEAYIDTLLKDYHSLLPTITAVATATHAVVERHAQMQLPQEQPIHNSLNHVQQFTMEFDSHHEWIRAGQQHDEWWSNEHAPAWIKEFVHDADDDDDDVNPVAELNRMNKELAPVDMKRMAEGPQWPWERK